MVSAPTAVPSLSDFVSATTTVAEFDGWLVTPIAGRDLGFLLMFRGDQALGVLLKAPRPPVTPAQQRILDALAGAGLWTAVWRPADWRAIQARLALPAAHDCVVVPEHPGPVIRG